jgi:hypothetical protein
VHVWVGEQTHVVHLATVKETPDLVMDVTVKGLFQLLEVAKDSPTVLYTHYLLRAAPLLPVWFCSRCVFKFNDLSPACLGKSIVFDCETNSCAYNACVCSSSSSC